jgi:hypothetical protein
LLQLCSSIVEDQLLGNRSIAESLYQDLSLAGAIDPHFQAEETAKDVVMNSGDFHLPGMLGPEDHPLNSMPGVSSFFG